jgi:exonuclease VII small subunit
VTESDIEAKIRAQLVESAVTFEEMADSFDAAARNLRALVLLINADVDLEKIVPHLESGMKIYSQLPALKERLEAQAAKWNGNA